jgi:alpha-1,3-rhamnosyl/mannosyltransferase
LQQLKYQVRKLKLEHRIHFIIDAPQSTLIEFMRKADALAFVSLHEGFGLPILEAMLTGIPVLCADTSSIPEVAKGAALYVNAFDTTDIAAGLQKILLDQTLRQALIARGMKRAAQLNWEETARKTLEVYRLVLH